MADETNPLMKHADEIVAAICAADETAYHAAKDKVLRTADSMPRGCDSVRHAGAFREEVVRRCKAAGVEAARDAK